MVEGRNVVQPVKPTERMVILDALRGFALMVRWAVFFLLLPVVVTLWRVLTGVNPADWLYERWWSVAAGQGITADCWSGFGGCLPTANGFR